MHKSEIRQSETHNSGTQPTLTARDPIAASANHAASSQPQGTLSEWGLQIGLAFVFVLNTIVLFSTLTKGKLTTVFYGRHSA